MMAEELALFRKVRLILEEVQRPEWNDWLAVMPNAGRHAVLNVKMNNAGAVLVNLKPDIKPRTQPIGDDRYFANAAYNIHLTMTPARQKEIERIRRHVPWPYQIYLTFEGQDSNVPQ